MFATGVPKGNFIENKGDSSMAQITQEEREDAALGAVSPNWRTLLLDYWFTAQNGWNISRDKLINPCSASVMEINLLSVIILMDCCDWTLAVEFDGWVSTNTEQGDSRGEALGEVKKRWQMQRTPVSAKMNEPTAGLLTFLWQSVAFHEMCSSVLICAMMIEINFQRFKYKIWQYLSWQ